jgi:hypothetical protein
MACQSCVLRLLPINLGYDISIKKNAYNMVFLFVPREWQEHPPRFLPDFSRGAPDRVETAAFAGGTSPRSILLDGIFFSGLKHGKHFISRLVLIPLCLRLFQIPNACAPLQFTNRLMPTTRSPTPPPLLSYNPEDSEWQQQG